MKDVLNEIAVLPGVVGSCLFSKERGRIYSGLPSLFTDEAVLTIANRVTRLVQMGVMVDMDVQTIALRYDIYTIMAMPVNSDALLVIACESRSNCSLIAMTISMLAGELQSKLAKETALSPEIKEIADKSDDGQDAKRVASVLKQVRGALAFVVGPMADMVFDENFALWTRKESASLSRLSELIEMLSSEIGNDSAAEFTERIKVLLP